MQSQLLEELEVAGEIPPLVWEIVAQVMVGDGSTAYDVVEVQLEGSSLVGEGVGEPSIDGLFVI